MIDWSLLTSPRENVFVLKKWNWDYEKAHAFQLACVDYVRDNPQSVFLIFCSHPPCFTHGRGLQKMKEGGPVLVEYHQETPLPFPLHVIKRGGGLTFHYPGQIVFYPILNLTYHGKKVFDLMLEILSLVQAGLETQFLMSGLQVKKDLLGLWYENEFSKAKLASIGLAASRFITYHGLALNFFHDDSMFTSLRSLHPCGLPGDLYSSVERLNCRRMTDEERELFCMNLCSTFLSDLFESNTHLMMDKQRSSSPIFDSISF